MEGITEMIGMLEYELKLLGVKEFYSLRTGGLSIGSYSTELAIRIADTVEDGIAKVLEAGSFEGRIMNGATSFGLKMGYAKRIVGEGSMKEVIQGQISYGENAKPLAEFYL